MEVDDQESELVEALFQCTTTDRAVLTKQFLMILGNRSNITVGLAEFYLQMNGWNVDEAISSYFDVNRVPDLSMTLIQDMTVGEGESVPGPGTPYTKVWRVRNSGTVAWLPGCVLRCTDGQGSGSMQIPLETINPGSVADIRLDLVSPQQPGIYQSKWRACSPDGAYFGDPIWMITVVETGGVLGVTQQLNSSYLQ